MKIKQIQFTHFRNYQEFKFKPDNLTILIGPNGVGKTNLIEGVRFLSLFKSFRAKKQTDVIKWGEKYLRLAAELVVKQQDLSLDVYQDGARKQIRVNQVKKPIFQSWGIFKTTLFVPDDIIMVAGAPGLRRRWLDVVLSQKNRRYLKNLIQYYRVLKQRNQVLVRIATQMSQLDELEYWDHQLVDLGTKIQAERKKLFEFINQRASLLYQKISAKKQTLLLKSKSRPFSLQALREKLDLDLRLGSSALGPHLDDFYFELAGKNIAFFGSRGEYRSVILILKLLEADFLSSAKKEEAKDNPIILLDDILSELDKDRKKYLFQLFSDRQIILTATDLSGVPRSVQARAKIIQLS